MKPKVRKLLTAPHLFVRDMVRKRVRRIRTRLPRIRTVSSPRRYSVVSAVYDVAPYLDEFLRSLERQSLHFDRHIEVILVDDGSRDRSPEIIAKWQAAHPRAIRYLRKENGGQASARNLGLEHATGDWVTFIDPDDFVDEHYFQRVDELLSRPDARDVVLVGCKIVLHRQGQDEDSHALRSQFASGDRIVPVGPGSSPIQLQAASTFFRGDLLRAQRRRFDEEIRPNFEDGHFIGRYLLDNPGGDLGLSARARYFYRKRDDGSSTLDRSWSHPGRYSAVIERGYLDLLRAASRASGDGRPALWAQRTVLYELAWYLTVLVDGAETIEFLSDEQRARFRALVRDCFSYIDAETILGFDLEFCTFDLKVGMLGLFKSSVPPRQRVLVDAHDEIKRALRLRVFHHRDLGSLEISSDGDALSPDVDKERPRELLGDPFVHERILWIRYADPGAQLRVAVDARPADIEVPGAGIRESFAVREITRALDARRRHGTLRWHERAELRLARSPAATRLYGDAFLFLDRDTQADDNAEHLYRYVLRNRPDINAFFVLRRSSHDWARLEREGFRLIPFGSIQHRIALVNARHVVSSHADHYVLGYPTVRHARDLQTSRFTFLQHGVIMHDLSRWLNPKNIDCFVTASPAEHESIAGNGSPYRFTRREVVLTGLPRHDALGAGEPSPERVVLVMPTWRRWLVRPAIGKTAVRQVNPAFFESEFAARWKSFLHSRELESVVLRRGYRVRFFPHANLEPYLDWFEAPRFVDILSHRHGSIQEVFRSAAVMVTDYSSTTFEMAYLRRPVLYYHFDAQRMFGGGHTSKAGYFEYQRDGFGPVCTDEATLIRELGTLLERGAAADPEYVARMERALPLRDGDCARRTLDAILDLDRPGMP